MKKRTTPSEVWRQWFASARYAVLPLAMIGGLSMSMISACGDGDVGSNADKACIADDDCDLGTVCILTTKTCKAVDCDFCIAGQICYEADSGDQSCSKPECTSNSQCGGKESCIEGACTEATCADRSECPEGQICNALAGVCQNPPSTCSTDFDCPSGNVCKADGSCGPGCTTDLDCADVMTFCNTMSALCEPGCRTDASCAADQKCNAMARQCECDQSKCAAGSVCDATLNACVEKTIESCDDVVCGDDQFCNPSNNFQCEPNPEECSTVQGDPNACGAGERCNQATGQCEIMMCNNGKSQADCDGTVNPVFSMAFCECVQCVDDSNCPAGASCNSNGQCIDGCQSCSNSGECGAGAPDCFNGCCVECTTTSECSNGDICLGSGRCGPAPSCVDDPTVCPVGTMCVSGTCQSGNPPMDCTNDPTSCPPPTMCVRDPLTMMGTCQGGGGGGMCHPDCIQCLAGLCIGCTSDSMCNAGQTCSALFPGLPGICG